MFKKGFIAPATAIGFCLLMAAPWANAIITSYEWTATRGLAGANADALSGITGQSVVWNTGLNLFVTAGSAEGSFTYDSDAPLTSFRGPGYSVYGDPPPPGDTTPYSPATSSWNTSLVGASNLVGSIRDGSGEGVVGNGNAGTGGTADLLNVGADACQPVCHSFFFEVGDWAAASISLIWTGGDFLDSQDLPDFLPPTGFGNAFAMFGFFNPVISQELFEAGATDWSTANTQIYAGGLEVTAVPEPSTLVLMAVGFVCLLGLRARNAVGRRI